MTEARDVLGSGAVRVVALTVTHSSSVLIKGKAPGCSPGGWHSRVCGRGLVFCLPQPGVLAVAGEVEGPCQLLASSRIRVGLKKVGEINGTFF